MSHTRVINVGTAFALALWGLILCELLSTVGLVPSLGNKFALIVMSLALGVIVWTSTLFICVLVAGLRAYNKEK